jgi:Zn-dependent membrane protease YugP
MYYDYTFLFLIPGLLIALFAQIKLSATYAKYQKIESEKGMTGYDTARMILDNNGLSDVQILRQSAGKLSDFYNPVNRTVSLSPDVYTSSSLASIGIAAHECSHAIQHEEGYAPMRFRTAILPFVNFATMISWGLIIAGMIFYITGLAQLGIIFFSETVLFQLVTLPIEVNASKRALAIISDLGIVTEEENIGARQVLRAAAWTYIAGLLIAILQLLRLIAIFGRRR